jgi:hypothetical protein
MMADVSAEDVASGKDVQGIPWDKMLFPRDQYREVKLKTYKNYQNLTYDREDAVQVRSSCTITAATFPLLPGGLASVQSYNLFSRLQIHG